ncbi:hypothetical protein NPIL_159541 [Nephila pilipes]|uniref:Uncharacterized protein n=1 Tax=Nephila pilipes TaxID=299642 RepID=A0A8X6MZS5_NEPPI|nr:hypothetical protein NPIL_159541 [Nephila pilipes]
MQTLPNTSQHHHKVSTSCERGNLQVFRSIQLPTSYSSRSPPFSKKDGMLDRTNVCRALREIPHPFEKARQLKVNEIVKIETKYSITLRFHPDPVNGLCYSHNGLFMLMDSLDPANGLCSSHEETSD